jgi:hypothetical protein
MEPGQLVVISKNTFPGFSFGGRKWIGTTSFPSLNNDKDELSLFNPTGEEIAHIQYNEEWHSEAWKKNGGWSLERMDTNYYCVDNGNWASAKTGGGSPGLSNSASASIRISKPLLKRIYTRDSVTLRLYFDYPLRHKEVFDVLNYTVEERSLHPSSAMLIGSASDIIELHFAEVFAQNQVQHIHVKGLFTCYGATINECHQTFGLASQQTDSQQVRINEILFDPKGDGSDYVELVNTSTRILDLKNMRIANCDDNGNINQVYSIFDEGYNLLPGAYALLCTDENNIMQSFPQCDSACLLELAALPTFPNDKGEIVVLGTNGTVIDRMHYDDGMHSPIISNPEGISLEKFLPEMNSDDPKNWTSAASTSGYGTPGKVNSQWYKGDSRERYFHLGSDWVSPDNDGDHDILSIHYKLDEPGYFLKAVVFSESGMMIATPYENFSISGEGDLFWDGNVGGTVLHSGNYVILLEAYHPEGKIKKEKLTFSVLKRT